MVPAKGLHNLIKRVIADNDAVLWFKTTYDHINGTKNSDIRKATDQLHSLKLKSTQSIQENVANIEETFRVLKVASGVAVTDDQKLYHLQEKLEHDARISILSIMASSKTTKTSYDDTISSLILLDPAPTVAHKMASLTPGTELCRRHIAGLCTNRSSCKYSHASVPTSKGTPSDKKRKTPPPLKKDQKTPPKIPFKKPIVVLDFHWSLVGCPKGVASAKNPAGYSLNQLTAIRTLQSADVDGWTSGDPQYFQGDGSSNHIERLNVFRFQIANPQVILEFPEFYFIQPLPRLWKIRRNLYTIFNSVENYNKFSGSSQYDYDGSKTGPLTGIVVALQDLTSPASSAAERKMSYLFVGFLRSHLSQEP